MSRLTDKDKNVCELCGQRARCTGNDCQLVRLYNKLAHYEDLEEQGRLIELPCKVGDTVWVVGSRCLADEETDDWCEYHDCNECSYDMKYTVFERKTNAYLTYSMTLGDNPNFLWGETVFATKAEAEAKLAEMGGAE